MQQPLGHLGNGLSHEVIDGKVAGIIIAELPARRDLVQDDGDLGKVLPLGVFDLSLDDVESFGSAIEIVSRVRKRSSLERTEERG